MKDIIVAHLRAQNLDELLALSGEAFVGACYATLLGREPDAGGLESHLRSLNLGMDRLEMIAQVFVASEEGRVHGAKVAGLAEALIKAKLDRQAEAFVAAGLQQDMADLVTYLDLIPPPAPAESIPAAGALSVPRIVQRRIGPAIVVRPRAGAAATPTAGGAVWYDLTDLFQANGEPRPRMRAELDLARRLKRALPDLRFLLQVEHRLLEVDGGQIGWLFDEPFLVDAFVAAYGAADDGSARTLEAWAPVSASDRHPCGDGDLVIAWASPGKKTDRLLAGAGGGKAGVKLCHILSAATISAGMVGATPGDRVRRYLWWLSARSALMIFTSETARMAMSRLQRGEGWPSPPQVTLDISGAVPRLDYESSRKIVADMGVAKPFALYAGSLAPGNNLETLYRAWILALELDPRNVPQLVLCGSSADRPSDLLEAMNNDPRLAGKLALLVATDRELAALFRQAAFVLSPAIGDDAIHTLRTALDQGKACIAADSGQPPADAAATYVHAIDVRGWAKAIISHGSDPALIAEREAAARRSQPPAPAGDGIDSLMESLRVARERGAATDGAIQAQAGAAPPIAKPTIWMDLTLTFLEWGGHITGIVRAELTFAYYLKKLAPETRYFAHVRGEPGYFFEINAAYLDWLFDAVDLSDSYRMFNAFWKNSEAAGTAHRNPFRLTGGPVPDHPACIASFPPGSVIFFAAIDQNGTGALGRCREVLPLVLDEQATMTSQLIYDLTPFLMPQVHHEYTVRGYTPFVRFVSDHFDHLLFGGRTSQRDCLRIQQEAGWGSPPNDYVEFGSDIALAGETALPPLERQRSVANEKAILARLGIDGAFVMTVGSLEPRKNHELLYKAYLELLERGSLKEKLQLLFIGKPGWKTDDLLATIAADERVRGKLLILSPDDEELEALYFQCRFTLLPSFYEGWSLTLPESLSYGKFCLVSDVDPLRETGGDLAEYIHPLDTMAWADRIEHYINHPDDVAVWEAKIRRGWHPRTWRESTQMLIERLHAAHADRYPY